MTRTYELIDRTDNDVHDTGTREEMQAFAAERNADEARNRRENGPESDLDYLGRPLLPNRWTVKPEGYAAANFNGDRA